VVEERDRHPLNDPELRLLIGVWAQVRRPEQGQQIFRNLLRSAISDERALT
jgi:hypothetical protein